MKVEELRIGNWIAAKDYNKPFRVAGQTFLEIIQRRIADTEVHQPITLNEEWLIKFGFEHYQAGFWRIKIHADQDRYLQVPLSLREFWDVEILIEKRREENIELWIRSIHYVHQLQNLYFALTGEELTTNAS